ncbi:hypothetical protein GCM10007857_66410 [Bradyrhizobium iriomotense]|uniref:Uncharacterized protein n=1 Tax=Bradyrhizobium iriomotense TaxID=441950 RepID=A0ABQ6BCR8_9BRAD|nr:hypothetical protein GCM10007857_66410 [Bradyrhizobium iriomotense]
MLPSPSASICENRSFRASCGLIEVDDELAEELDEVELEELLVLADDWLCAAISALIVSGEICGQLPELTDELAPLVVLLPLSIENGLVAPCVEPVCCVEDVFEDVNACNASSAPDTAPRANNIRRLQTMRQAAANAPIQSASVVPAQKPQSNPAFARFGPSGNTGNSCRLRQNFPPTGSAFPALLPRFAHVRRGPSSHGANGFFGKLCP